jgi:predicted nucleic acid-binding protein
VILIDANILVYAHVASLPQHQTAFSWLDQKLSLLANSACASPIFLRGLGKGFGRASGLTPDEFISRIGE